MARIEFERRRAQFLGRGRGAAGLGPGRRCGRIGKADDARPARRPGGARHLGQGHALVVAEAAEKRAPRRIDRVGVRGEAPIQLGDEGLVAGIEKRIAASFGRYAALRTVHWALLLVLISKNYPRRGY